ncbi:MAG: hypothetical protein NTZ51_03895 [Proteobacteria bacterium]|nr:hypothetical protein [Pseudomonadota bacterium]
MVMSLASCLTDKILITVSGSHSGIGKTLLAEYILSLVRDFAAIKITIEDMFTAVSSDEKTIMVPGKDTFRLKARGATKVVWVRSPEESLADAMEQALGLLSDGNRILIEGNSILSHISPDIAFFVSGSETHKLKPSRLVALRKAHVIINNIRDAATDHHLTEQCLRKLNAHATIVSLNLRDEHAARAFLRDSIKLLSGGELLRETSI